MNDMTPHWLLSGEGPFPHWERVIEAGNHALQQQDVADARLYYRDALSLAQTILQTQPWQQPGLPSGRKEALFDAAIAAAVVSHHNLAALLQDHGSQDEAAQHYRQAHRIASDLSADATLDDGLRRLAARHMTRALGAFIHFQQQRGLVAPHGGAASDNGALQ